MTALAQTTHGFAASGDGVADDDEAMGFRLASTNDD
jgi:hypothetical protein